MKNKNILIGLTGSIAAYKTAELIRLLKKEGANVKVVPTESSLLFIGEKTLETLSCSRVYFDTFERYSEVEHISLAEWADLFVIAPMSANTLSKIASGIADNLLTSLACAYIGKKKPLLIAPAMNEGMWLNPFVQENVKKLEVSGVDVIYPDEGFLACNTSGIGRMQEPKVIFEEIFKKLRPEKNKKILVTAGGTKEKIDPVRFLTNASSGKTGTLIADLAYKMGYDVTLVSTFDIKRSYPVIKAEKAEEMFEVLKKEFPLNDYLFMAAAVSDFKVREYSNSKIRKKENYTIELDLNPDILKNIGQIKTPKQKIIGFSLTTDNTIETAKEKLKSKNCDYIIANEPQDALNSDCNQVWIIDKEDNITKIEKTSKENVAKSILELVL